MWGNFILLSQTFIRQHTNVGKNNTFNTLFCINNQIKLSNILAAFNFVSWSISVYILDVAMLAWPS